MQAFLFCPFLAAKGVEISDYQNPPDVSFPYVFGLKPDPIFVD
jgi:hypothetical protein